MRPRTVSSQAASRDLEHPARSLPQHRSPCSPIRSDASARSIGSRLRSDPSARAGRVCADAAGHPDADADRARLRARVPGLYQCPEHGPDRGQLRGQQPDAWATSNTTLQTQYRNQILADATATNCQLPQSGGADVVPDPTFSDTNGDGSSTNLGDTAKVADHVHLHGHHTGHLERGRRVRGRNGRVELSGQGGHDRILAHRWWPGGGTAPNAAFIANSAIVTPDPLSVIGPDVSVDFRDTSGGSPGTDFAWTFALYGLRAPPDTSNLQDVLHDFSCAAPRVSTT